MLPGPAGSSGPTLVAVAHGSRSPAAQASVAELLDVVRALRPGLRVREAYVELSAPSLPEVLRAAAEDVVVVPLLLGNGYHVAHDVAGVASAYRSGVPVAAALGPHPLLVDALAGRLCEVDRGRVGPVVLAAAGSSDPRAHADTELTARLLAWRLGRPVRVAYTGGSGPRVPETVAALRAQECARVTAATYLLSPGRFAEEVRACGADAVSAPLGAHPALARLVLARYDARVRTPADGRAHAGDLHPVLAGAGSAGDPRRAPRLVCGS